MGSGEFGVTEEAIQLITDTSSRYDEVLEQLRNEVSRLEAAFEENEGGLGAHSGDIKDLLDYLKLLVDSSEAPIKRLQLKLGKAALIRTKHIQENGYGRTR